MKIPGIKYTTNVRSLGRARPMGPIIAAQSLANARLAWGQVGLDVMKEWERQHTRKQVDQSQMAVSEQSSGWEQAQPASEYVLEDIDLPDDVTVDPTEKIVDQVGNVTEVMRENIPRYELYPQLRERFYKALILSQAEGIDNAAVRSEWTNEMMGRFNDSQAAVVRKALVDAEQHRIELKIRNIEKSIQLDLHEQAATLINESDLPQRVKEELHLKNNKQQEYGWYYKQLELAKIAIVKPARLTEAVAGLRQGIKTLENEKYDGLLNQKEQYQMASLLSGALGTLLSAKSSQDTVNIKLLRDDLQETIAAISAGQRYDIEAVNRLLDRARVYPDDLNVEIRELEYTEGLLPLFNKLRDPKQNYGTVNTYNLIQELATYKFSDPLIAKIIRKFGNVLKERLQKAETDPIGLAVQDGVIASSKLKFDFDNIPASIAQSIENAKIAYEHTGGAAGLLTDATAIELKTRLENAPLNSAIQESTKISIIGEIQSGAKDRSPAIYEQLVEHGLEGSYYVAGLAVNQGDVTTAEKLINGNTYRKTKPAQSALRPMMPELNMLWQANTGGAYMHTPELNGPMYNAFLDMYLILAQGEEDYTEPLAVQAHDMVTGGLVAYGDQILIPPYRGYSKEYSFDDYVTTLHHSQLLLMGSPLTIDQASTKKLMKAIAKEEVELIRIGVGIDGTSDYVIVYQNKPVFDKKTGLTFKFKVLEDPLTKKQVEADARAEELANRLIGIESRRSILMRQYRGDSMAYDIEKVLKNLTE